MSRHTGSIIASNEGYAVLDCERCGWAHLDPLPDEQKLAELYAGAYYEYNPGWLEKDRSEQAYWDLEHADKLADWQLLLGREQGAVLDVGCSNGLLLEFAAAAGWQVAGIEPAEIAAAEARTHGVTVYSGLYQEVDLPACSFDVVHSKLLVEHLPNPTEFFVWARRLLRPGGVITVHVPNDFNVLQLAAREALGLHDWWVAPPFHLNYFGFGSLERLLETCGLRPIMRDATFPMEWFLLMGEDYVAAAEVGADAHRRRMLLEQRLHALDQRRALHAYLAQNEIGREAIVHARWDGHVDPASSLELSETISPTSSQYMEYLDAK